MFYRRYAAHTPVREQYNALANINFNLNYIKRSYLLPKTIMRKVFLDNFCCVVATFHHQTLVYSFAVLFMRHPQNFGMTR